MYKCLQYLIVFMIVHSPLIKNASMIFVLHNTQMI